MRERARESERARERERERERENIVNKSVTAAVCRFEICNMQEENSFFELTSLVISGKC